MKKILLTGGAGYIGSHIAVQLYENGYIPVVIDNFSNSQESVIEPLRELTQNRLILYKADCNSFNQLSDIFKEHVIEGVIHLAAFKAVGESVEQPLKYYENNIQSLVQLLKVMRENKVNNLVFSSSCTVYGTPDKQPVTEETPWKPAFSPYGYTKQICENILKDTHKAHPKLSVVSLRYFNPVGAHPSGLIGELPIGTPNNLIPYITQVAAGIREHLTVFGNDYDTPDGTCIRDYIHVVDVAEAHVSALDYLKRKKDSSLEIFNIGTGKGVSVQEIIDIFQDVNKVPLKVVYGDRRPGDVEGIYADVTKGEKELNWKAKYDIKDSLKHAWKWQQNLPS